MCPLRRAIIDGTTRRVSHTVPVTLTQRIDSIVLNEVASKSGRQIDEGPHQTEIDFPIVAARKGA